ncbi:MAG: cell division protein ZapA, partial [Alphaproteobacteria bacterium]|nr:cell division protein ZapA [Alphaproteobacteria bacterium]
MGMMIDKRVVQVEQSVGRMNATRQLLYAALWLADELNGATVSPPLPETCSLDSAAHDEALARIAERLEALVLALEA